MARRTPVGLMLISCSAIRCRYRDDARGRAGSSSKAQEPAMPRVSVLAVGARVVLGRAERPSRGSAIQADSQCVRIHLSRLAKLRHGSLRGTGIGERLAQAVGCPDRLAVQCDRAPDLLDGPAKRLRPQRRRSRTSSGRGSMPGRVAKSDWKYAPDAAQRRSHCSATGIRHDLEGLRARFRSPVPRCLGHCKGYRWPCTRGAAPDQAGCLLDCTDGRIREILLEELHPSLEGIRPVPLGERNDRTPKRRPRPGTGRAPRPRSRPESALAALYGAYSAPNEPRITSRTSPTPK